jgi:transketolase
MTGLDPQVRKLRKLILEVGAIAQEGHIPSALSILDLVYVVYTKFLSIESKGFAGTDKNRFILSKGHASLGLYAVLHHVGIISEEELLTFTKYDSKLGGHPDRNKIPNVELSTGSLGHGLPQAVGIANALALKCSPGQVYVLIGDGEANEGTVWESALLASHHRLQNLTCIIDNNLSTNRALEVPDFSRKFRAFGWEALEINGHDHSEISNALQFRTNRKPIAIVANTIKGFGVPSMESNPEWHHRSPNSDELALLIGEML